MQDMDAFALENMIDKLGLDRVLDMISEVCYDKAEHARSTWQDERLARRWEKTARAVNRLLPTDVA